MINFNQLRAFHEAARCQNFSQAARNLCVTQPAVTGQIRALETNLGIRLFKRRGRRMALTDAGVLLFQHARAVYELERRMERDVEEVKSLKRGLLKIGTTKTYARYLMPALIRRFHDSFPQVRIILDEGSSLDVCRSLTELRNELAVVAMAGEAVPGAAVQGIDFAPFRDEQVVLFVAPQHPLARRPGGIAFAELEGELIVLKEEGSSTRAVALDGFTRHGMTPNVLVETSNQEFIKEMVEQGEGVGFLVRSAVEKELAQNRLRMVPIVDEPMALPVYIAHLEGEHLSPAASAFVEILEEEKARGTSSRPR